MPYCMLETATAPCAMAVAECALVMTPLPSPPPACIPACACGRMLPPAPNLIPIPTGRVIPPDVATCCCTLACEIPCCCCCTIMLPELAPIPKFALFGSENPSLLESAPTPEAANANCCGVMVTPLVPPPTAPTLFCPAMDDSPNCFCCCCCCWPGRNSSSPLDRFAGGCCVELLLLLPDDPCWCMAGSDPECQAVLIPDPVGRDTWCCCCCC
mmetsp:Transcript_37622/g.80293  ORF Transcript_37622/g.80293 Transcript_37622/m.80293 type:complete len:213 (+) Transcript_37622:1162-1800(+)